jgi:protein SSD1
VLIVFLGSASIGSNGGSNRSSSFNLVPFTPTRVNFSRDDANPHQRRPLFIAHLPFSALTPLFRARQLVRGILRVNKRNRSDAYVSCDELDGGDIYICGSRDRNRALEGDVVAVRLVNVEKVIREKQEKEDAKLARNHGQAKVRLPDEEDENEIIFGGDEEIDAVKPKYAGVVVAILERAQNQVFSGTLTLMRPNNKRAALQQQEEEESGTKKEAPRIVWFKATDKRVPLIAIPIEQVPQDFVDNSESYKNRLFVGSIKRWPITSLHPFGTLENELGAITDLDVQIKAILADNNVSDVPFSDAVMECVPPSPFKFTPPEDGSRRDLTVDGHRMITIDPKGSTIFEDGLSIVRLGDDTYEVGVHVSDIAYFIKPHSPLDKEARARAVSVSLDQKEVPMLPTELSDVANFKLNELK